MRTWTQRRFFVVTRVKVRAGVSRWGAAGAFLFTHSRWFSRKGRASVFITDAAGFPTPGGSAAFLSEAYSRKPDAAFGRRLFHNGGRELPISPANLNDPPETAPYIQTKLQKQALLGLFFSRFRRKPPPSARDMAYNGEKGVSCHEKPPEG